MYITICGSVSFAKEMLDIKEKLETRGDTVIVPANIESYANGTVNIENKKEKMMLGVIKVYFEKIKNSDAILVLNYDKNNISNYIGGNSLIEIAFAHVLDKKIFLYNPIPKMSYSDEIEAMKPIVINGDLEKIQ